MIRISCSHDLSSERAREIEIEREIEREIKKETHLNLSSMALRVVEVFMVQLPSFSVISMTGVEAVAA